MILKKPYAFLIKYFRIIHLLLLIPIGYLFVKTNAIVSFFRSYVKANYSTSIVNIAGEYINYFMYLAIILILGILIAIYYLMRQKKKSTKLYFFAILYYLLLFVLIGIAHSILTNMAHDLLEARTARAYRDISMVLCLPQYFFFGYMLIRGIGFDIKKFNFANDLDELEIRDVDSEEFEFRLNVPGYKVERNLRRFVREFKYYVQENTFVFGCITAFFIIFVGTVLYMNFQVYNKTYHVSDKMTHNYFNIEITDSIITNLGFNGNVITEGKYYLVLQLDIENKTNYGYELDYTNFRLVLNGKDIYPTLDRGDYFIDYGTPYKKESIKGKTKNFYVLTYELDESELTNEYIIKILEGIDYKVGEIAARYKNIKLHPKKIDSIKDMDTLSTGKILNLKDTRLGYTTLKVDKYELSNSYTYSYQYCYSSTNCQMLKDKITTDISGTIEKTTLLILDTDFKLDETTIYANNIKLDSRFFDYFLTIRYTKDGKTLTASLRNRTTSNMGNTVVFETREELTRAEQIDLVITARNQRYIYNLK